MEIYTVNAKSIKMIKLKILLIFCLTYLVQFSFSAEKDTLVVSDFDSNGVLDTVHFEGYGNNYEVADVNLNGVYKESIFSDFNPSSFMNIYTVPAKIATNKKLMKCIEIGLFGKVSETKEPSLAWLLQASANSIILDNNVVHSKTWYLPVWIDKINIPEKYTILLKQKDLNPSVFPEIESKSLDFALLLYVPSNNFQGNQKLSVVDSTEAICVYKTAHAVIVKKNGKYTYSYINDSRVLGSSLKLRSPSILDAKIYKNNSVVILSKGDEFSSKNKLFLCNYENGICVELSNKLYDDSEITDFKIQGNSLIINSSKGTRLIDLAKANIFTSGK